jgi:hypothetical protein
MPLMEFHLKELTQHMLLLPPLKYLLMELLLMLMNPTSKDKSDLLKINLKMLPKPEQKKLKPVNKLKLPGKLKQRKSNRLLMLALLQILKK